MHAYIDNPQEPTRTSFVRGRKQSGMYISIPIAQDHVRGWGVYICPREFSYGVGVHGRVIDLKPSSYELSEASFEAEAKAGWFASSWRPLLMYVLIFVLVFNYIFAPIIKMITGLFLSISLANDFLSVSSQCAINF